MRRRVPAPEAESATDPPSLRVEESFTPPNPSLKETVGSDNRIGELRTSLDDVGAECLGFEGPWRHGAD